MKIIIGLIVLILLVRYAGALRLTIPLLYAFIIPTICAEWYYEHYALANGIWYGMLALVALSWTITAIRRFFYEQKGDVIVLSMYGHNGAICGKSMVLQTAGDKNNTIRSFRMVLLSLINIVFQQAYDLPELNT